MTPGSRRTTVNGESSVIGLAAIRLVNQMRIVIVTREVELSSAYKHKGKCGISKASGKPRSSDEGPDAHHQHVTESIATCVSNAHTSSGNKVTVIASIYMTDKAHANLVLSGRETVSLQSSKYNDNANNIEKNPMKIYY
ncbi:hypothetical protein A7U60_g3412 [Sanghuangporus baumii]|uniref:Uncharacterized protein n=1 Tax=Sanghuangporus baumii TaxID=108892 RepID=A0A9Q5I0W4_SANBA|nr:hypothetical protein A7U60_g3412 [Sanghuangporus baumii]